MGKRMMTALLLLLPITLSAQSKAALISHIRQVFLSVSTDSSLHKVVLKHEQLTKLDKSLQNSEEDADVTGYYRGGLLVKIVYELNVLTGMETAEYYLENGRTIFIYIRRDSYPYNKQSDQFNYNVLNTTFEGRYYFSDRLIKKTESAPTNVNEQGIVTRMKKDVLKYAKWLSGF